MIGLPVCCGRFQHPDCWTAPDSLPTFANYSMGAVSQSVSQLLVHITQQKEAFSFSSERISSDVCCRNDSLSRFQRTVLKSSPSQTLVLTFLCMHANSTLLEFCTFPVQLLKMKYSWCAQLTDVISGRKKPDFLQSNDTAHLVGSEVKWPQQ